MPPIRNQSASLHRSDLQRRRPRRAAASARPSQSRPQIQRALSPSRDYLPGRGWDEETEQRLTRLANLQAWRPGAIKDPSIFEDDCQLSPEQVESLDHFKQQLIFLQTQGKNHPGDPNIGTRPMIMSYRKANGHMVPAYPQLCPQGPGSRLPSGIFPAGTEVVIQSLATHPDEPSLSAPSPAHHLQAFHLRTNASHAATTQIKTLLVYNPETEEVFVVPGRMKGDDLPYWEGVLEVEGESTSGPETDGSIPPAGRSGQAPAERAAQRPALPWPRAPGRDYLPGPGWDKATEEILSQAADYEIWMRNSPPNIPRVEAGKQKLTAEEVAALASFKHKLALTKAQGQSHPSDPAYATRPFSMSYRKTGNRMQPNTNTLFPQGPDVSLPNAFFSWGTQTVIHSLGETPHEPTLQAPTAAHYLSDFRGRTNRVEFPATPFKSTLVYNSSKDETYVLGKALKDGAPYFLGAEIPPELDIIISQASDFKKGVLIPRPPPPPPLFPT